MPAFAFILGRESHLSVAEIAAVVGDRADWTKAELSAEALVVPTQDVGDGFMPSHDRTGGNESRPYMFAQSLSVRLGGTIKIGEVWRTIWLKNGEHEDGEQTGRNLDGLDEAIGQYILECTNVDRKVHFGYSVYDLGAGAARVGTIRRSLTRGAAAQKTWLTEHGRTVRWVTSREPTLSSVVVAKNNLMPEKNGVEVLVLVAADHTILVRTLAVQPYREWSARDYGRPCRDARSGMLPPKLARAMVNIALARNSKFESRNSHPVVRVPSSLLTPRDDARGASVSDFSAQGGSLPKDGHGASGGVFRASDFTLLDPFCGSGTVLTEAMALGIPRIIGTDASAEAVRDAKQNVEWMRKQYSLSGAGGRPSIGSGTTPSTTINVCDVLCLSRCVAERVDMIVTEPYLGPSRQPIADSRRMRAELHELYVAAFREFAKVLKPGGRVVFIVPVFRQYYSPIRTNRRIVRTDVGRIDGQEIVLDITRDVEPLGFLRIEPFPAPLRDHPTLRGKKDLPYARPDQRVGREILCFTRS